MGNDFVKTSLTNSGTAKFIECTELFFHIFLFIMRVSYVPSAMFM